jgi:nucleoside 2-deoxyribosyltransferase
MSVLYIAGPYRADTRDGIEANIQAAREVATAVWEAGHVAICPHLNTAHFNEYDHVLDGYIDVLSRCDGLVLVPNSENSRGTQAEWLYATRQGIPVYDADSIPAAHPTEQRCPQQVQAFRETVMRMYRVHLDKNADYSPANILGTGYVGLVTRLWDKTARLMNLSGFRITISESTFEQPREPKHESIDDTLLDAACYSIIGMLLRRGVWGK